MVNLRNRGEGFARTRGHQQLRALAVVLVRRLDIFDGFALLASEMVLDERRHFLGFGDVGDFGVRHQIGSEEKS